METRREPRSILTAPGLPTEIVPTCCLAALVIDGTHIEWAHEVWCPEGVRDHV